MYKPKTEGVWVDVTVRRMPADTTKLERSQSDKPDTENFVTGEMCARSGSILKKRRYVFLKTLEEKSSGGYKGKTSYASMRS